MQPIATTQVRLALRHVLREQVLEQRHDAAVELLEAAVARDVLDDPRVEPGERAQLGLVVRVGQEAHVEQQVGVARRAVLEAERQEGDGEAAGLGPLEHLARDLAAQHRGAQARRVDEHVGARLDRLEQLRLAPDAVDDVALLGQRVPAARLLVAREQRLLAGAQEQHAVRDARRVELVEHLGELLEVGAAAQVGDDGRALHLGPRVGEQVGQRADHLRRQVVHAEVARVLEHLHRQGLAGAREAGDDDEVLETRLGLTVAVHGGSVARGPVVHRPVLWRWP